MTELELYRGIAYTLFAIVVYLAGVGVGVWIGRDSKK